MKLEERKLPRKVKGIEKGLEISGFGILNILSEVKVDV